MNQKLFSLFESLTLDNYRDYEQGLNRYNRHPRYYQSPLRAMHQPSVFKVGWVGHEAVIIKDSQIMGNRILYAILPPADMLSVEKLRKAGVPCYLDDSVPNNCPSKYNAEPIKNNMEYIYNLSAFSDRYGVNKNQLRRPCNKAESLCESGAITIKAYWGDIPYEMIESCKDLTIRWLGQRNKTSRNPNFFLDSFNQYAKLKTSLLLVVSNEDMCLGYHLSHSVSNGLIYDTACKEYVDTPIKNMTPVLLHYASKAWADRFPSSVEYTRVNRGAAVRGAASRIAKEKLRPIVRNQIHKTIPDLKMTRELRDSLFGVQKPQSKVEWL